MWSRQQQQRWRRRCWRHRREHKNTIATGKKVAGKNWLMNHLLTFFFSNSRLIYHAFYEGQIDLSRVILFIYFRFFHFSVVVRLVLTIMCSHLALQFFRSFIFPWLWVHVCLLTAWIYRDLCCAMSFFFLLQIHNNNYSVQLWSIYAIFSRYERLILPLEHFGFLFFSARVITPSF